MKKTHVFFQTILYLIKNNLNLGTFMIKWISFSVDVNLDLLQAINVITKDSLRKRY